MSGHVCTLLGADPLRALGGQALAEAPDEGSEDQSQCEDRDDRGERGVAGGAESVVGGEEEQRGADHEGDAEPTPVELDEAGRLALIRSDLRHRDRLGVGIRSGVGGATSLTPEQRDAGRGQDERPDQLITPPDAELTEDQQPGERQQPDAGGQMPSTWDSTEPSPPHRLRIAVGG